MSEHGSPGRYLFAVARGLDLAGVAGVTGLRGAPLELVEHGDLQGVVCDVDLDEFGEAALARNLEDMAWLEEVARCHNDVVFALARHSTVAPMRMVTIYADDDSVRARLLELEGALTAALDRVQGRREWSVKVLVDPSRRAAPAEVTAGAQAAAEPGAGAAYLRRKRDQATRRQAARGQELELADEVHAAIASHAVAARRLAPQDPRLTGRTETMVLNAAYLVPIEQGEEFRALVTGIAGRNPGSTVEVEGPWPPYSFATLD